MNAGSHDPIREEKHRAQYNHHSGAIPPATADQPRGGDAPFRVERPEVPQFAGIDPEILPAGGGWAHGRRRLSVGVACRGRAAYSKEWREHVAKLFGGAPEITWFDTPVIVDNAAPASKAA